MQRQEKDPLGQMFAFILFPQNGTRKGNLSSALLPDTVSMATTALGSATEIVRYLHGGAGLQQQHDHLDVAIQRCQVQGRSASGRRPRGSPHGVKAWANESWKTRKLRKLRVPKIVSPGRANIAHHLTKECQEKHKERRELLPMKKLWLGIGKDCVPVSSETLFKLLRTLYN